MLKLKTSSLVTALIMAGVVLASCATTADVLVNKEPGLFYGSAFDSTQAAAEEKAYLDLVYNVLTESKGIRQTKKANFVITKEIRDAFAPFGLKPRLSEKKSDTRYDVVFSLSREQWEKAENVRVGKLDKEFGAAFTALKSGPKPTAAKIKEAAALTAGVAASGAENRIVGLESGAILSDRIDSYCSEITAGITISALPSGGLVKTPAAIGITVAGKDGKPEAAFPIALTWKADGKTLAPVKAVTDDTGKLSAAFPDDPLFKDRKVTLSAAADLSSFRKDSPFLQKLDQSIAASFTFRNASIGTGADQAVKVKGGTYTLGSVKQDRRAGSVEKPRKAAIAPFYIDRNLVTNAEFKTYLEAVNAPMSDYPDYWDNPDFNKPEQPVIGVSLKEAEKYAAWLSSALGVRKRLPTEDEFEAAARGGLDSVYPWGDQLPSDGARATFSGTASATTPVGSRENGRNPLGLYDMAGNVWEWTTTAPAGSMSGNQDHRIVKGGSYMDGQYELRVSNRALRDPEDRHPDVGFRLVSEATNE